MGEVAMARAGGRVIMRHRKSASPVGPLLSMITRPGALIR